MRKVHPAAKLKTLGPDVQDALWEWFCEDPKRTLVLATDWLKDEHQIITSVQRVSEWRGWYARKIEIETAESEAHELEQLLGTKALSLTPDQISAIGNAVFLNRATKLGDAKTFVQVAGVVQRSQELKASQQGHTDKMEIARATLVLKEKEQARKVKELELKVATFEAKVKETKEDLNNPQLSEAERAQRMRSRFGV